MKDNKSIEEKAKGYDNKLDMARSIGLGGFLGTVGFSIWDVNATNLDCALPVAIFGAISLATIGFTLIKQNPYKEVATEEEEIILEEQPKVKKIQK